MRNLAVLIVFVLLSIGTAQAQFCPGAAPYVFTDVPANDDFCQYITWMAETGLTTGCQVIDANNRNFCPDTFVTRKQMSAFLSRLADEAVFQQGGNAFGATAVIGTIDAFPVEVLAAGQRLLRLESKPAGPNVVAGSSANGIQGTNSYASTIAGGGRTSTDCQGFEGDFRSCGNLIEGSGSSIGGGTANVIVTRTTGDATIGGGGSNTIGGDVTYEFSGYAATIGGGRGNVARGVYSTIAGGVGNQAPGSLVKGAAQAIGGGAANHAGGTNATIPGGVFNVADGESSFAAGRRAKSLNDGCFTWGDSTDADVECTTNDAFVARAVGGFTLGTNAAMSTGCSIAPGGGMWACSSARDSKDDLVAVNAQTILARVSALPIWGWKYRTELSGARHLGPTAEDFHAVFGLGDSDRRIGLIDAIGVALAAIQGLNAKFEALATAKDAEIAALKERLAQVETSHAREMAELRMAVEVLMARASRDGRVAAAH